MSRRIEHCKTLTEKLFILSMLGDERHVSETYILGELVKNKDIKLSEID